MAASLEQLIRAVVAEGKDMVVATVRPDGAPQATMVSYASDGLRIYFGTSPHSQKARNLAHDARVSIAINLPYRDWSQIRGLSLFGRARRLSNAEELLRAGELFSAKYSEIAQYVSGDEDLALFEVIPEFVSLLDYRQGFGHVDQARVTDATGGRVEIQKG